MLAIAEPFRGKSIDETFDNILHKDPVPPRERSPNRNIPVELEKVALRAMNKKPVDRYQSMRMLIDELHDAIAMIP